MARFPGAIWNPIDSIRLSGLPMAAYNRVNLHVAVSEAASLHGYFNAPNRPSSHFYVRKDGTAEQYVDTSLRAEADLEGNDATISIETQGGVTNANGEPWTDAQVATLAAIYAWAVQTHGISNKIATDAVVGDTSKGLSWHRLGIDPWRASNAMHYSNSRGKICPGDAKIAQIPEIFAKAQEILGTSEGSSPVSPAPTPKPKVRQIAVDGKWGADTTRRLQEYFGTPVDGVISHQWKSKANENIYSAQFDKTKIGSTLGRALQRWAGASQDGLLGSNSVTAMQRKLGTPVDGVVSSVSAMVKEMQRRLNANTL